MATASPSFNLVSSEDVEGTNVYDPAGNKIGQINHLMIDTTSGNVRYAVVSFGGFLGLGRSHYPMPWNAIRYDREREGFIANATEQQLKDAPEFVDDSWTDREWERRWHNYFGTKPYWDECAGAFQSREPM
jgi:sporulation protein YlmC with PRC-barrel domain